MHPSTARFRTVPYLCGVVLVIVVVGAWSSSVAGSGTTAPAPVPWSAPGLPPAPPTTADPDEQVAGREATRLVQLVPVDPQWLPVATAPSPLLSSPLSYPAVQDLEDAALLWSGTGTWQEASAWVQSHLPAGSTGATGWGSMSRYGVVEASGMSFGFPPISGAIQSEQVSVEVAPLADGGVGIRADAQVIWYPSRPLAEVVPSGERSLTVDVSGGTGVDAPPTAIAVRTITDPDVLSRIGAKVDGLLLQIPGARSCPAGFPSSPRLTLTFSGGPEVPVVEVVDDTSGCGEVTFTVGGEREPPLEDDGLFHLVDSVLGLSLPNIDTAG